MTIDPVLVLAPIFLTTELLSLALCLALASLRRSGLPGVAVAAGQYCRGLSAAVGFARGGSRQYFHCGRQWHPGFVCGLYYAGCAHFLGQPPRWNWLLGGAAAGAGGKLLALWGQQPAMRVMAISVYSAVVCTATAWLMLKHYRGRRSSALPPAYRAGLHLCAVAAGAQHLLLHPVAGTHRHDAGQWLEHHAAVSGAAIMPALSMAAVLMLHESLQTEAENARFHDRGAVTQASVYHRAAAHPACGGIASAANLAADRSGSFKVINDTFGHAAGDEVLRAFAELVRGHLRGRDALGRLGGEEFAILLPDASVEAAWQWPSAARRRSSIWSVAVSVIVASISIGVAGWHGGESFDQLCRRADQALYQAKNKVATGLKSVHPG
jgi:diguanylate cyclase (GGDEF)-like protein